MEFWSPLIVPLGVALALVFLPGLAVLASAGLRGTTAVMAAPPLSVAIVAVSAVLFGPTGLDWSVWMPVVLTLLVCLVGLGARELLGRRRSHMIGRHARADADERDERPATGNRWGGTTSLVNYGALALATLLWLRHGRNLVNSPDAISQTVDNINHLTLVRFMLDTGNASSLSAATLTTPPDAGSLYPAAWHGLVALVVETSGLSVPISALPIASHAILFAAFIAWSAGCLFLVHSLFRATPVVILATAVLSASFPAFPLLFTQWGALLPNLLGLALAPAAIGLGLQFLGAPTEVRRIGPVTSLVLLLVAVAGIGFAHPNAVLIVLLVAVPALVVTLARALFSAVAGRTRRRTAVAQTVGGVLVMALIPVIWQLARPGAITWGPLYDPHEAIGRALTNAAPFSEPAWVVSGLMVLGLYRAFRSRRLSWLPFGWGLLVYVWVMTAGAQQSAWREFLTGVFYSDPYRLAAALPLLAVPLGALGLRWVDEALVRRIPRGRGTRTAAVVWPLLLVSVLTGVTQRAPYLNRAVDWSSGLFRYTDSSTLLTEDEHALLARLPELVPPDAVVATDPWNGSSLAYPLANVAVTEHHPLGYHSPDHHVLAHQLNRAADDPEVCRVLDRTGAEYALDFGAQDVGVFEVRYPGFEDLERAEGFEPVAAVGDAALYRITACG